MPSLLRPTLNLHSFAKGAWCLPRLTKEINTGRELFGKPSLVFYTFVLRILGEFETSQTVGDHQPDDREALERIIGNSS